LKQHAVTSLTQTKKPSKPIIRGCTYLVQANQWHDQIYPIPFTYFIALFNFLH